LALNQNQPLRPNISFYAEEFVKRLITKKILIVFNAKNIVKVAAAIVKLEDEEDLDKKLDTALQQVMPSRAW
jgi:hypothetical protein